MNRVLSLPAVILVLAGSIAWAQDDSRAEFTIYRVDAEGSDIRLLVHRAGALSRLGHSHVISVGQIAGTVYVHPDLERAGTELSDT